MQLRVTIALLLFASAAPDLRGQTTAQIVGVVEDSAGKSVKAARLALTGARQNARVEASTDESGAFVFTQLEPDTYELLAGGAEYSDYATSVQVGAGQSRTVNIRLNSLAESTRITIDERGTTMEQTSARSGVNVTARELAQAPLNGRTYAQLALTAPGASNTGDGSLDRIRFNGAANSQNHYTYDGVDFSGVFNTPPGWITASGLRYRLLVSVETLEEFRVDSSLYPAEAGAATGAVVNMISSAGTGEWHGSLFEYFRNDNLLSSRNAFDSGASELRMSQFGANVGGPLAANRLFVTGAFEGLRQATGANVSELVPGAAARALAVPAIRPALAALPQGRPIAGNPEFNLAERRGLARLDETTFIARLDYLHSISHRFYARYFKEIGRFDTPDITVTPRRIASVMKGDHSVFSWASTLGAVISNEFKLGLNRAPGTVNSSTGIPELEEVNLDFRGLSATDPGVGGGLATIGGLSRQIGAGNTRGVDFRGKTHTLLDNASLVRGAHTLKTGFELRAIRVPFGTQGSTIYGFGNLTAFLMNVPSLVVYTADMEMREGQQEYWSGYFQDEWRLRPNLTLNLGLRYEYFSPNRERDNRARVFDVNTMRYVDPSKGFGTGVRGQFAPRVAASWSPRRTSGRTVVRLGAGIYDGPGQYQDTMGPIINDSLRLNFAGVKFPLPIEALVAAGLGQPSPVGYDVPGYRTSERSTQYGLSVQQQLPSGLVGQAGYVGSLGRHLYQRNVGNLVAGIHPATGNPIQQNPAFGEIEYRTSGGTSTYNALQLALARRFIDGMTLGAHYTWSHGIGTSQGGGEAAVPQDPRCLRCDRADLPADMRHFVSAHAIWDLPLGKGRRVLNQGPLGHLLANWSLGAVLNMRSGLPINTVLSVPAVMNVDQATGRVVSISGPAPAGAVAIPVGSARATRRPDVVPGVNPYLKRGLQWLNPEAFAAPKPGAYGNLGRNALRGPGFSQFDFMLGRRFSAGEGRGFELRAEAFNLFNHPNYANPFSVLPNAMPVLQPGQPFSEMLAPAFGKLNATVGRQVGLGTSRQVQLGLRYSF